MDSTGGAGAGHVGLCRRGGFDSFAVFDLKGYYYELFVVGVDFFAVSFDYFAVVDLDSNQEYNIK